MSELKPPKSDKVKKGKIESIAEVFIVEDLQTVGNYIWKEKIVPSIKNTIVDTVHSAICMMLGVSKTSSTGNAIKNVTNSTLTRQVQYNTMFTKKDSTTQTAQSVEDQKAKNGVTDIYSYGWETSAEANEVLDMMLDCLERCNRVTVADIVQNLKRVPTTADYNWGWTDLEGAKVKPMNGLYVLQLPQMVAIK